MRSDEHVRWPAPAKLNLCLSVAGPEPAGGPRAGWHRISSWIAAIDLCDEVVVRRLREGEASRYLVRWAEDAPRASAIDWAIEKDLAVRAHRLVEERMGRELPIELEVVKRIPVGSGLGGGSSDAASVFMALNRMFGLALEGGALRELGMKLGSDVGFFVDEEAPPRQAIVEDFGDRVVRVAKASASVLVIVPPFGCATPDVYRAYDQILRDEHVGGGGLQRPVDAARVRERHAQSTVPRTIGVGDDWFNDLLPAAERVRPELRRIREVAGEATGRPAHLTGSGSALFVVAPPDEVELLLDRLRSAVGLEGCSVIAARLV